MAEYYKISIISDTKDLKSYCNALDIDDIDTNDIVNFYLSIKDKLHKQSYTPRCNYKQIIMASCIYKFTKNNNIRNIIEIPSIAFIKRLADNLDNCIVIRKNYYNLKNNMDIL